ncbi:MAG: DUF3810 domain-containing protein [Firmicutes bacterium]|nr:DUF3810 domain-containing protein [Bacillota bacterium]
MLLSKKRFWCVLLVPFSILLTCLAHSNPEATERWFSLGVYRFWTETYGRVFGYLPFSVFQFLIVLLPVGAVAYVIFEVFRFITKAGDRKKYAVRLIANGAFVVGIGWFMFTVGVGLNYGRVEFGETIGLETRPSYVAELAALTEILVGHVNEVSTQVRRNEYGHMVISAGSYTALSREAREVFRAAGDNFPVLRGFVPHTKPILYSRFMSRLRITGVFVPWTLEPHVNVHVMDYNIPATMIHELAHFRGIMREDEANFIAWLVGHHSGHPDFMYSGAMLALSYAAGQLSRVNRDEHTRIMGQLCLYARIDRRANWEYWQQFQGPLAEISQAANDAYLRAQRQEDGVRSYGRVVDLLLAYFRDEIAQIIG